MRRLLFTFVHVFALNALVNAQAVVIIVNSENSVRDISSDDLRNIFTVDKTVWDDGNSIQLVDWKNESNMRERFYTEILKKPQSVVRRRWIQKIVSGDIYPPSVLASEEEIINYVATHRGAIAYVQKKSLPGTVKKITLNGHTPDDPNYELK